MLPKCCCRSGKRINCSRTDASNRRGEKRSGPSRRQGATETQAHCGEQDARCGLSTNSHQKPWASMSLEAAAMDDGSGGVRAQHSLGVLSYLRQLLSSESFVDVTLCCVGGSLRAHRVLLSACSPYLQRVLLEHPSAEHTTIILADVHREDMRALLQFMYTGGVAVSKDRIDSFLLTAEALQVKVLKDMASNPPWESKIHLKELEPQLPVLSMRSPVSPKYIPASDGWRSADLAYIPSRSDSGCYSNSSAMSDVKLAVDMDEAPPPMCYPHPSPAALSPSTHSLFRTGHSIVPTTTAPRPLTPPHRPVRTAFEPVIKSIRSPAPLHSDVLPRRVISQRHSPELESQTKMWRPMPQPHLVPHQEPSYEPMYPTHLPSHIPFPTSALPITPTPMWSRPVPLTLAPPPPSPAGTFYPDGGGRPRPLASILTPSPWTQSRRPLCGAPHTPRPAPAPVVPETPKSTDESDGELRESNRVLPPASSPSCSSPGTPQIVPKKRMSPSADAYRLKERRLRDFKPHSTSASSSVPAATQPPAVSRLQGQQENVLNLCVSKTSPTHSEAVISSNPDDEHPKEEVPRCPTPVPVPNGASIKNDTNNNEDQFPPDTSAICNSQPSPFTTPVRPVPTRSILQEGDKPIPAINGIAPPPGETTGPLEGVVIKEEDGVKPGEDGKVHSCEACGKRFSRRQLLVQHRRVHTGERPYSCSACGKQFTQRGHWSTHQKLHEPARTAEHTCESCGKAFVTRASLKVHQRTHTGEKPFRCTECGKTFSQLRNFKYHRSVHEGTREFAATCPECGKLFNDRGYLSSHMKIHRNRKEYGCEFCGKSFNQRVAYNMHVRIHTGEKPHQCPTCGKTFSRKMLLKQHLRIHTGEKPFSCSVCGKCFADRSNMTLHMRLHSGEKPYQCQVCCKSFTKKHHLKTHINYHTGLKPYACSKCGLHFSQSSNMRTHHKKCTGPPPGSVPPNPEAAGQLIPPSTPTPTGPKIVISSSTAPPTPAAQIDRDGV